MANIGGIIAGALKGLGTGAAQVGQMGLQQSMKIDLAKMMSEIEEQKLLRVDQVKRDRDFSDLKRKLTEITPLETQAMVARETAITQARGQAETETAISRASSPEYLSATKTLTAAAEAPGQAVVRQATEYKLTQDQAIGTLRKQLSETEDPKEREKINRRIQDLSGTLTNRSYADVVAMGNGYRQMASDLLRQAKDAFDETERASLIEQANSYQRMADTVFRSVGEARGLSQSQSTSSSVGTAGSSKYKAGDIVNLKSGGRGRVVEVDGKLMVQPL